MLGNEFSPALRWANARSTARSLPMPIASSPEQHVSQHLAGKAVREVVWSGYDEVEHDMDIDESNKADDLGGDDIYESDMELEGLDWKLEMDEPSDRPGNPVARQIEQSLTRAHFGMGQAREVPISKRQRFGSGSIDSSVDGQVGSEGTRQHWSDGTPPEKPQMVLRHMSEKRTAFTSPPPSPCIAPLTSREALPSLSASPLPSPSVAVPRYYTGGPVGRVDTPKTPSQTDSNSSSRGQHSPSMPAWRGNNSGSTPPTIFYVKPVDLSRGGSLSPLREVIRNLGI